MLESPLLPSTLSYINGTWVDSDDGDTFAVHNPANGEQLADVAAMGPAETERAIGAAKAALAKPAPLEERRGWIAEFSELGDFLDMPFRTYSAGMRMRLNFAIATAFTPEILLMDEWLSAGDARFRQKATERMQELVDNAAILVFASHNPKMLEQNCSQAIWLDSGHIRMKGSVPETYAAFAEHQKSNGRGVG
jgi:ABC-type polysaccharide/polyol phosphate transport system ATPase subunit